MSSPATTLAPPPATPLAPAHLHAAWQSSKRGTWWLKSIAILGGAAFAAGLYFDPARAWPNFLLCAFAFVGVGLAGALFVSLHYVTGARWSTGIRRVPEALIGLLPLGAALMALVVLGAPTLYAWADRAAVSGDEILKGREGWMNVPFFAVRLAVYFAVWTALGFALVRRSRRSDADGDPIHRAKNVRNAALFLVAFAVTFSLASIDWVLSVERHWSSTIFAIYHFSGLFLSGLAVITWLVVALRRRGVLARVATDDVLHDLGKLLFAFTLFWGYIWFCQYMLTWYVNNPEETAYYLPRHAGGWVALSVANVLLNWTIPFAALLPREAKRRETVLVRVAIVILIGRWLDLYVTILPPSLGASPAFGVYEVLLPAGTVALFLLAFRRSWSKAPAVPLGEPLASDGHSHGS